MVEIPELSKEEIQKTASEMLVGIMVGTGAYIRQKLGPVAEDELGTMAAEGCAMNLNALGVVLLCHIDFSRWIDSTHRH
jgi:hypothetical protein